MDEPNPLAISADSAGSFNDFSRGRKAHKNTRVIADSVYTRLRDAIQSAELRPNLRLVEDELADWLNVSRTPIREALLQLEKDGLVERDRGWVVHEHNPAEIQARMECRIAIESYAARLSAIRRSETDLRELENLANKMEDPALPHIEFHKLNHIFHRIIVECAGNQLLTKLYDQTKMNYWDLSVPIIFGPDIYHQFCDDHRRLIQAIASGDGEKAQLIARDHIQTTMKIVMEAVAG